MKKLKKWFIKFWNDNEVSDTTWKAYHDYKKNLRSQGKNTADVLPPIGRRNMVLCILISIIIMTVFLIMF
jgi:hypothetical protein